PMDEAAFNGLPVPFVEIVAAEFAILRLLREEHIDDDQEAVRHRDGGTCSAPACRQAPILGREVGFLGARRRLRRFHEGGPQPEAALAGASAPSFAAALVVTRTQPRPGREVARAGEAAQIRADLVHPTLRKSAWCDFGLSASIGQ